MNLFLLNKTLQVNDVASHFPSPSEASVPTGTCTIGLQSAFVLLNTNLQV